MGCKSYGKGGSGGRSWKAKKSWKKSWKKDGQNFDHKSKHDKFKKSAEKDGHSLMFEWKKSWKNDWKKKEWKKDWKADWKSDAKGCLDKSDAKGISFQWKGWKNDAKDKGFECKIDWKACKVDWSIKRGDCKTDWGKCKDAEKQHHTCKIDFKICDLRPPKPDCEEPELPEPPVEEVNLPPVITGPFQESINIGIVSSGTVVTTVTAEDPNPGDVLVFSINGADDPESPDADMFSIDPETGAITLIGTAAPFGSADGDSFYRVEVEVSDGELTDSIELEFAYFTAA